MANEEDFNQRVEHKVTKLLNDANTMPYLFVGAGISRRYMETESWKDLLKWVCDTVGAPMSQYRIYLQEAKADGEDLLFPRIASLMEKDFIQSLRTPKMSDWADEHGQQLEAGVSAMKMYIAEHLLAAAPSAQVEELEVLKKASDKIAGAITTNYDNLLEGVVFPGYSTYVGEEELLFSSPSNIGEIFKIHGSISLPETLVLTEKDYENFEDKREYLNSKILTIFGEYPIIFLGYSMNDENVQSILAALAKIAGPTRAAEFASRFLFVDHSSEHVIGSSSFGVGGGTVISMSSIKTDDFTPIYKAIGASRQLYAPRVIGQLTKEIYKAVVTREPTKVVMTQFANISKLPPNKPIVLGLSLSGYGKPVDPDDMYEDALFDNKGFDPKLVVSSYLENALKENSGGLPMFKYLSQALGPVGTRIEGEIGKRTSIDSYRNKSLRMGVRSQRGRMEEKSIACVVETYREKAYAQVHLLNADEINLDELSELLKQEYMKQIEGNSNKRINSELKRSIRIYDFLRYRSEYERNMKNMENSHILPH
jgi:hypothetical protein